MSQPQPPPPPPTPTPPLPTVQQQNLPNLATIVPSLTVAQLKQCVRDIRSQFGYCMTIGGNKPELVRKMLAYIAQNPTRLEAIRQVIQTNLGTPTWSLQNQSAVRPKPGYGTPSASSSPNNAAPSSLPNRPAFSLTDWLKFRPSPFIEIINPLSSPIICNEVYGNRFSVKLDFFLNSVQTSLLEPFGSNGPSSSRVPHQLLFYCTTIPTSYHHYPPPAGGCLVEFPTMCEIKVNSKLLEVNLRGLRKRPGSVYPPNITPFCSKGIINKVDFTYQHTQQKFVVCVYFCRRKSIDEIVKEIKEKRYLSKELVLETFQKKSKEKDDIVTTQSSLSLRDPIAFHRINVPCRSTFCTHAQCFDAKTFLSMNEQTPTWTCPLCNRELKSWDEVIVDGYFESILNSVSPDIDAVVLEPDYGWRLPNSSGNTHEKERSSDMRTIVNLEDDETITTPTTKKRPRSVSCSPPPAKRISMQNNFIDLTVESDEGEPIAAGPMVARSKDVGKDCASKTTHVTPVAEAVTPTAAGTPAPSTTPPPVLKNVSIQDNSTPTLSPPYPRLPLLPIHTEPSEASPFTNSTSASLPSLPTIVRARMDGPYHAYR